MFLKQGSRGSSPGGVISPSNLSRRLNYFINSSTMLHAGQKHLHLFFYYPAALPSAGSPDQTHEGLFLFYAANLTMRSCSLRQCDDQLLQGFGGSQLWRSLGGSQSFPDGPVQAVSQAGMFSPFSLSSYSSAIARFTIVFPSPVPFKDETPLLLSIVSGTGSKQHRKLGFCTQDDQEEEVSL